MKEIHTVKIKYRGLVGLRYEHAIHIVRVANTLRKTNMKYQGVMYAYYQQYGPNNQNMNQFNAVTQERHIVHFQWETEPQKMP